MEHLLKTSRNSESGSTKSDLPIEKSPKTWNSFSDEKEKMIRDFFMSEDVAIVAWTSPLARDFRLKGTSEKVSRFYLTCTLHEAHNILLQKFPDMSVSFPNSAPLDARSNQNQVSEISNKIK